MAWKFCVYFPVNTAQILSSFPDIFNKRTEQRIFRAAGQRTGVRKRRGPFSFARNEKSWTLPWANVPCAVSASWVNQKFRCWPLTGLDVGVESSRCSYAVIFVIYHC